MLEGVKANEDYVLTHWDFRDVVEKRHRRIRAAFDYWDKSPAINTLPKRAPRRRACCAQRNSFVGPAGGLRIKRGAR